MLEFLLDPYNYLFWIFIIIIIIIAITIVWWPFNIYIKFSYINAKVEAIGNPFLDEKELNHLIDSKSIIEFKDSLNTNKDYKINGNNSNDIQKSLDENYIKTIEQAIKDSSKNITDFYNIFYEKIDLEYIKKIIKNKIKNKPIDMLDLKKIYLKKMKNLSQELVDSDNEKIQEILLKYGINAEIKDLDFKNSLDLIILDNRIDLYIIKKLKNVKVPQKCQKAKQDFVNSMIDIKNLKNILRAKRLGYNENICNNIFLGDGKEISNWKYQELLQNKDVNQIILSLEGTSFYNNLKDSIEIFNKEQSTQIFEKVLDEYYLNILKEISIQNYVHIGPILRFLISKEYEIINLKIISKGIEEKINSNIIKNLLVMVKN